MDPQASSTLNELAQVRNQIKAKASGKKEELETLPTGAGNEPPPVEEEVSAENTEEGTPAAVQEPEEETVIRIGEKTFKTQSEAIKYAEGLEHEKELAEAHAQGITEALRVTQPQAEAPKEETDAEFDAKFYTNPRAALKEVEDRAAARIRDENATKARAEGMWNQFFSEYPDLDGRRNICELVLRENWDTIGKMTDTPKAMKILATKTRAIFQDYAEAAKPRTELSTKSGQVVSAGGGSAPSVTPKEKNDKVLDFASQLRTMRRK